MTGTITLNRSLVLRTLAMPADMNPTGGMFGGWLMGQMDMAAGMASSAFAKGPTLTVAVDEVRFHRPLRVGEIVEGLATLERVGHTSMAFKIEILANLPGATENTSVCQAKFTMVSIDSEGRPTQVDRTTP